MQGHKKMSLVELQTLDDVLLHTGGWFNMNELKKRTTYAAVAVAVRAMIGTSG
jgi:DNA-directed RNA polymerase beta' subunit